MLFPWLSSKKQINDNKKPFQKRRTYQPLLEILEDRTVPSTVMAGDDGGPGDLSLKITQVNTTHNVSFATPIGGEPVVEPIHSLLGDNPPILIGKSVFNNDEVFIQDLLSVANGANIRAIPFLTSLPVIAGTTTPGGFLNPNTSPGLPVPQFTIQGTHAIFGTPPEAPLNTEQANALAELAATPDPFGRLLTTEGTFSFTPALNLTPAPLEDPIDVTFTYRIGVFEFVPSTGPGVPDQWIPFFDPRSPTVPGDFGTTGGSGVGGFHFSDPATVTITIDPDQAAGNPFIIPPGTVTSLTQVGTVIGDLVSFATPWPTFSQNSQRTGTSPIAPIIRPAVNWVNNTDRPTSSPVIGAPTLPGARNSVWVGGDFGLRNLDGGTGSTVYALPSPYSGDITGTPAVDVSGDVYVGYTSLNRVVKFAPNSAVLWDVELRDGERIVTAPALPGLTGLVAIQVALPPAFVYIASESPGGLNSNGGRVYGMLSTTGAIAWETVVTGHPRGALVFSYDTFAPSGYAVYVRTVTPGAQTMSGFIYKLDARTGQVLWQIQTEAELPGEVGSPVVEPDGSVLYYTTNTGRLSAVNTVTGAELWNAQVGLTGSGSPALDYVNRTLYIGHQGGLSAFNVGPNNLYPAIVPTPVGTNTPLFTFGTVSGAIVDATPTVVGVRPFQLNGVRPLSTPVVYFTSMEGTLHAIYGNVLAGASIPLGPPGTQAWSVKLPGDSFWKASPIVDITRAIVLGAQNSKTIRLVPNLAPIFREIQRRQQNNNNNNNGGNNNNNNGAAQAIEEPGWIPDGDPVHIGAYGFDMSYGGGSSGEEWIPAPPRSEEIEIGLYDFDPGFEDGLWGGIVELVEHQDYRPDVVDLGSDAIGVGDEFAFTITAEDPDPYDTVVYSLVDAPSGATIDANTGEFSWTPDATQLGTHTFTVRATDNFAGRDAHTNMSSDATITVWVVPTTVEGTVLHGRTITLDLLGAGGNPQDPPFVSILHPPQHGFAQENFSGIGLFDYTADWTYTGPDFFIYEVIDSQQNSTLGAALITVTDTAPVATNGSASVLHGQTVTFSLSALGVDADQDPLSLIIIDQPDHGFLNYNPNTDLYEFTADLSYSGTDSFTFKFNDLALDSNTATFTITITNQAPTASNGSATAQPGQLIILDLFALGFDPDGDPLNLTIVQGPNSGFLNFNPSTGLFELYIDPFATPGTDTFSFKFDDGEQESEIATFFITIEDPFGGPPL